MIKRNFLLGKGERLTKDVKIMSGPIDKVPPYTFSEAKARLEPMLKNVIKEIEDLPDIACPDDYAIATVTLNPEYIAKSYYPSELLRSVGLETVGSRSRHIKPEKRSKDREPEDSITTELFVRGTRKQFYSWGQQFSNLQDTTKAAQQIVEIEEISFPTSSNKIKNISVNLKNKTVVFEIVLHVNEESAEDRYLGKFKEYLKLLKLEPSFNRRFYAGGLAFVEVEAPVELANEIAKFSLVRVMREMPSLRLLRPSFKLRSFSEGVKVILPKQDAIDAKIKAAIFDGGIPEDHPITKWATPLEFPGMSEPDPELLAHGVSVTSAFLFGHIDEKKPIPRPYASVDHYRVLDNMPGQNPYELYEVLERIKNALATKDYNFINLSLGPRLPIDDDEVHAWTAVLDEYLSNGETLATIAVGNDGEGDSTISANRVQVPADCVNAIGIGACDVPDDNWQRASYSSVGPGRSPGIIKPDLVDFGGTHSRPFLTLDSVNGNNLTPTGGTSFSAPSTLRIGTGVRAHFGNSLNPLALRTLLVHCSESADISPLEIGWGRVARSLDDIVICEDHVMRVVYQGSISASKYIRVPIPLPTGNLKGMVNITATLCYATAVDPHHPDNYTRSGLELIFRPNKENQEETALHPKSKSFFSKFQKKQTEEELKKGAWKWENCLHAKQRFLGKSLNGSVFDIHYNARIEGHNDTRSQEIKYAMVITVEAPKITDLYNQVVRKYATQLEALQPIIDIPLLIKQ